MKKTMAIVLSRTWGEFQPSLYDLETTAALTDTHPQLLLITWNWVSWSRLR